MQRGQRILRRRLLRQRCGALVLSVALPAALTVACAPDPTPPTDPSSLPRDINLMTDAQAVEALGFLAAGSDEADISERLMRARVFAGYAGWGPGQLDEEVEAEAWILEPADPGDAFSADTTGLWGAVLARKGRDYALLATMPPDPSVN